MAVHAALSPWVCTLILFAIIGALVMGAHDMNLADVMRWGFMPTSTHVQSTDVPDLSPWSSPSGG